MAEYIGQLSSHIDFKVFCYFHRTIYCGADYCVLSELSGHFFQIASYSKFWYIILSSE